MFQNAVNLCIFSVLLTLFLGLVHHLEVFLESPHLVCSDRAPEARFNYKWHCAFMSCQLLYHFQSVKDVSGLCMIFWGEFTPQPFSQLTLSCLLGSSDIVGHPCMFSVHFHFRIECLSQARGLLCVSADQSYLDL